MSDEEHLEADQRVTPPGQRRVDELRVRHYGPVPRVPKPEAWTMSFWGASAVPGHRDDLTFAQLMEFPQTTVTADFHCAGGTTVLDNVWGGVLARDVIDAFPPADEVEHVMVYAQYGYCATVRLGDLASPRAILATHHNGEPLAPEHGYPVRLVIPHLYSWKGPKWFRGWEYLDEPRRGFWEERGYHFTGDAWREERFSYQEH